MACGRNVSMAVSLSHVYVTHLIMSSTCYLSSLSSSSSPTHSHSSTHAPPHPHLSPSSLLSPPLLCLVQYNISNILIFNINNK